MFERLATLERRKRSVRLSSSFSQLKLKLNLDPVCSQICLCIVSTDTAVVEVVLAVWVLQQTLVCYANSQALSLVLSASPLSLHEAS